MRKHRNTQQQSHMVEPRSKPNKGNDVCALSIEENLCRLSSALSRFRETSSRDANPVSPFPPGPSLPLSWEGSVLEALRDEHSGKHPASSRAARTRSQEREPHPAMRQEIGHLHHCNSGRFGDETSPRSRNLRQGRAHHVCCSCSKLRSTHWRYTGILFRCHGSSVSP